jgi:hypothetical protein
MAAGDGMADIVGRRWGRERKWPFSATKSYAGKGEEGWGLGGGLLTCRSICCGSFVSVHAPLTVLMDRPRAAYRQQSTTPLYGSPPHPPPPPPPTTGTAAFVLFGFLVSLGLVAWFGLFGLVPALTADVVARIAFISVACALVELVRFSFSYSGLGCLAVDGRVVGMKWVDRGAGGLCSFIDGPTAAIRDPPEVLT